jgi:hypothetical protein
VGRQDEFRFAWKKITGTSSLRAKAEFLEASIRIASWA